MASRLLRKPHIQAEVRRLQAEQLRKAEITGEMVLEQLRRIAFFDVASLYEVRRERIDPSPRAGDEITGGAADHETSARAVRVLKHPADWPADARAALESFDTAARTDTSSTGAVEHLVKIRMASKLGALELLAKHLGLLTDRTQVDQTLTIQWLPPEPPPPLPIVETIDAMGPPQAVNAGMEPRDVREERMGFACAPGGPPDRTRPSRFSDSREEDSSSVAGAGVGGEMIQQSATSRRLQERMCPELRLPDRVSRDR